MLVALFSDKPHANSTAIHTHTHTAVPNFRGLTCILMKHVNTSYFILIIYDMPTLFKLLAGLYYNVT
jgi:hypothetical protein